MKSKKLIIFVLFATLSQGCSPDSTPKSASESLVKSSAGNEYSYADGRCTEATVQLNNDIAYATTTTKRSEACTKFKNFIGTSTCTAKNTATGAVMIIPSFEIKTECTSISAW